jgi:predicted DNA-binding transcriptional regulator YafY
MLGLLSLLQTRRDWPGQVLAHRLGVTTRTVRRDVDRLRELGYRVTAVKGPDGGYRLEAGSELPPLLFDDGQAVAIAVALQGAASSGVDIGEDAERALATVRRLMPSRLRHRVDGVRFEAGMAPGAGGAATRVGPAALVGSMALVDPAVLDAVSVAVRDRLTLRFDYGDAEGAEPGPPRRAEPHGIVARHSRWYLVAWDLDREDWRLFRLDRIAPRAPAGPRFAPRQVPTGDVRSFVAARATGSDEADRWPCVGTVDIALPARDVAPWVPDGDVEPIDDHLTRVTLGSWSWTGLLAQVLRFDAPFRVVAPEPLVTAARDLADRMRVASGEHQP